MVLKIHGAPTSPNTKRVTMLCKEFALDYELVELSFWTEDQKKPEFVEKYSPLAQVPVLDDDGFVLYESRAIAFYLAAKARSPLLPSEDDVKRRARYEQAVQTEVCHVDHLAYSLAWEKIWKAYTGLTTDEERVKEYARTLEETFDAYDKILSKQKYLAGDELTLADLFHLPHGNLFPQCGYTWLEDGKRPNLYRWWKELNARPSWQAVKDHA
ncbi:glutathione S-transferase [Gloeophyllum trabeum ATCC 11539]|uniref:glutathione transferase n=1 Tax=Gloeophyllum trabeum (strain ATCC 11539 / FP-39264 / Madison 617) TaxID=670483 RepID=S7Q060_GLOTA|nr:glutathione S-transferase [Gloeophyllum trabeum ATCC 11539]EPQ52912.1 glutathione S-transferase [Gloeophyllum trabeum ATCC 11539]